MAACAASLSVAGEPPAGLELRFREPGDTDKPWAYWWWLAGNVTEASIRRDLQEMKRKGIGGLLLFDARGYHEDLVPPPPAKMEFMSDEWRRMFRFAVGEAERLGLEMSVNQSSCAGALKGPWEVGDDAPKKLVWTTAEVRGPVRIDSQLPRPVETRCWRKSFAIDDAALPVQQRLTKTNVAQYPEDRKLRAFQGFTAHDPLVTSGLLGSVRVEFGEQREVNW